MTWMHITGHIEKCNLYFLKKIFNFNYDTRRKIKSLHNALT